MPTIIDSLFLQLGIDTSKFSADQKKALSKISQFESETKKSADKAARRVKTVGEAFRDLADDTAIGASARRLDTLSGKLRALGQAGQVSGGVSGGLGLMAEGLGTLLSPATLAVGALGLLGKAALDFNAKMTAANATIARQAELSGLNAKKVWAWGQAAKSVGGSSTEIPEFLTNLDTQLAGGFTGFGNPGPMLAGMALMGMNYRPGQTVNPASLIAGYRRYAAARGGGSQGWDAARAMAMQTGLYDPSLFKFAMPGGGGLKAYDKAKTEAPKDLNAIIASSLKGQQLIGLTDIKKAALAERTFGLIQHPMQSLVWMMGRLIHYTKEALRETVKIAKDIGRLFNFFVHPKKAIHQIERVGKAVLHGAEAGYKKGGIAGAVTGAADAYHGAVNASVGRRMVSTVQALMAAGLSRPAAEAIAGNFMQESSLNPQARNGSHFGLAQWGKARQALARRNGFDLSTASGQIAFTAWELHNTPYGRQALARMNAAKTLQGKIAAFDTFFERSGELAYNAKTGRYSILGPQNEKPVFNRFDYGRDAQSAMRGLLTMAKVAGIHHTTVNNRVNNATRIGDIHVHTPTLDPYAHASAVRRGLADHPLLGPTAQHQVTLSTHGMAG